VKRCVCSCPHVVKALCSHSDCENYVHKSELFQRFQADIHAIYDVDNRRISYARQWPAFQDTRKSLWKVFKKEKTRLTVLGSFDTFEEACKLAETFGWIGDLEDKVGYWWRPHISKQYPRI
jgi:hypothetical protein